MSCYSHISIIPVSSRSLQQPWGIFNGYTSGLNCMFLSEAVFTYFSSLHVFRAGVLRNNCKAINVAKARFSPLFYGLSISFYMETFFRVSVLRAKCPPELLNFLENHEFYSVSGNDCKGEGGDCVLESFNRNIIRGLPEEQSWIRGCRNVESMTKVKK